MGKRTKYLGGLPAVYPKVVTDMPEVKEPKLDFYSDRVGWECPKCGTCWAPHVDSCDCKPSNSTKPNITKALPLFNSDCKFIPKKAEKHDD